MPDSLKYVQYKLKYRPLSRRWKDCTCSAGSGNRLYIYPRLIVAAPGLTTISLLLSNFCQLISTISSLHCKLHLEVFELTVSVNHVISDHRANC